METKVITRKKLKTPSDFNYLKRMITEVYPTGIVSIVADTYNLWRFIGEYAPLLKEEIEARDGKIVFRPDSGDPVKIVCGYTIEKKSVSSKEALHRINNMGETQHVFGKFATSEVVHTQDDRYLRVHDRKEISENEAKGCIQILDEQFGSTKNNKGYKELNPKVGLIYGDSITYERAEAICRKLANKGYASNNVVFGIGSFTYQYNTRDTFSIACKATYTEINGKSYNIFKDPVTDDGTKKSACGLLKVERLEDAYGTKLVLKDRVTPEEEEGGELVPVFQDGKLLIDYNFEDIKRKVCGQR